MADEAQRVRLEQIDWRGVLPFLHLFRCFRMAIHPAKLLVALVVVVLFYLSGLFLDMLWGDRVYPGEVRAFANGAIVDVASWRADREDDIRYRLGIVMASVRWSGEQPDLDETRPDRFRLAVHAINEEYRQKRTKAMASYRDAGLSDAEMRVPLMRDEDRRRDAVGQIERIRTRGVFDATLRAQLDGFERLIVAAANLRLGFDSLLPGRRSEPDTVLGALRDLVLVTPAWMFRMHTLFALTYGLILLVIWALLGGAIARMAAMQAGRDVHLHPFAAVGFSWRYGLWFGLGPLVPVILILCMALALYLFGLAFFGIPYLNVVTGIVGGLGFFVALVLGSIISLVLVGLALSANLIYPAIAVEGADGFDANSRAFSYVVARPWHLLFYNLVALFYMAVTYAFVGAVVFLAILVTQFFVSWGADLAMPQVMDRPHLDLILPPPELGRLSYRPEWELLTGPRQVAAVLVMVWVYLWIGLVAAYAVSFYFCSQTWIYLLLRRSADGTDLGEVATDATDGLTSSALAAPAPAMPDKVEPAAGK